MPQSKEQRQVNATKLAEERAKYSPQQQLARLDFRLGKGAGAVKERERLQNLIAKSTKKVEDGPQDTQAEDKKGKKNGKKRKAIQEQS